MKAGCPGHSAGLGSQPALQPAPEQQQGRRLMLRAVELEGFKSYAEHVVIGLPFGDFTCIVGPNGSGKSVVGEAIAFALGGNARMMRAHNLSSLVTHTPGLATPPAAARVTLQFDVLSCAGPPAGGNMGEEAARPGHEAPASPAPVGRLFVRRRVGRNGRSDTLVQHLPAAAALGDPEHAWQPTSAQGLREMLAPLGIQTEAVDRFIVMQHRQAVQVQEPSQLARFLELLIGTAGFEEQLGALAREAAEVAQRYDAAEEGMARLEARRRQLAPEVACWGQYREQARAHAQRKARVLGEQACLLKNQLGAQQKLVDELASGLAPQAAEQAEARGAADDLLARRLAAEEEAKAAERELVRLQKQTTAARLQAAKLRVRLKAVQQGAGSGAGEQRLQVQLDMAAREAADHRQVLADATAGLLELEGQEAATAARAQQLRGDTLAVDKLAHVAAELAAAQQQADQAAAQQAAAEEEERRCAGRVVAAEAEAAAGERVVGRQQERRLEAAQTMERLRQARSDQQLLVKQAQAQLQQSRQQMYEQQATVHEAQAGVQAELASLDVPADDPWQAQATAASSSQTYDQAVRALAKASSSGALPGAFHGRLHSVARLARHEGAVVGAAVNAALAETLNLASCLVVADRATAQHVVSHFERHRVGVAVCKILAELQQHQQGQPEPRPGGGGGSPAIRPLSACVVAHPEVAGGQALVAHLLGGWWLAATRREALQAVQEDRDKTAMSGGRRRSIVTLQGEIFKADGEVVGAHAPPPHLRPYLLTASFTPAGGTAALAAGSGAGPPKSAADRQQAEQSLEALEAQLAAAQGRAKAAGADVDRAAAEAGERQRQLQAIDEQLGAAQRSLQQLDRSGQKVARQAQLAEQARQQMADWKAQQAAAWAAVPAARAAAERAGVQLAEARAAYEAGMASSSNGSRLLEAEQALDALRQPVGSARLRVTAVKATLAAADRQRAQLGAAQQATQTAAAEAGRLQQRVHALEGEVEQQEREAGRLAQESSQLKQTAASLDSKWKAAIKRHEAATRRLQKQQVELKGLRSVAQQLQQRLDGVQAELAAASSSCKSRIAGGEGAPDEPLGRVGPGARLSQQQGGSSSDSEAALSSEERPTRRRQRLAQDGRSRPRQQASNRPAAGSIHQADHQLVNPKPAGPLPDKQRLPGASSDEGGCSAAAHSQPTASGVGSGAHRAGGSDFERLSSDYDEAPATRRRRTTGRRAPSSRQHGRRLEGSWAQQAATGVAVRGAEALGAELLEVAEEGQALKALLASISQEAVKEHDQAEGQLQEAGRLLDSLADSLQGLEGRQGCLQARHPGRSTAVIVCCCVKSTPSVLLQLERYQRFHAALTAVNVKLSGVYSQLTGGQGDAYCSYSEDTLAAFTDGVTFHVRPDRQRWRPFPSLSGGQQALATLALCFALQAAFPSPFYFFDEIDCALDTVNAARVADYIAGLQRQRQAGSGGAQYLLVSHRPQVYERAGCLVGVYSRNRASHAVTMYLPEAG